MKRLFLLLFAIISPLLMIAQTATVSGVRKREFRGVSPIMNADRKTPSGYYTFYVNERETAGMINFNLDIFDTKMNKVRSTPISISKRSNVDGAEFNGKHFMFVFNDPYKKSITYVTADRDGAIVKQQTIIEEKWYTATADLYPAGDYGFYIVKPIKEKKLGFTVEKIDETLKSWWVQEFTVEKGYTTVSSVDVDNGRIVLLQTTAPTVFSQKLKGEIVCLEDATGKKLFTHPLYDGEVTALPNSVLVDDEYNVITSGMYFEGERFDAGNSDGIFFMKLGPDGKRLTFEKSDWDDGIQKVLKSTTQGKLVIGGKPKVLFHNIVQTAGGSYQVIAESFKTNLALANSRLSDMITGRFIGDINDDGGTVTFEVMDFIIFNFDGAGKMNAVSVIEKEHTKISCYAPFYGYPSLRLAQIVRKYGFFNYAFTMEKAGSKQEFLVSKNFAKDYNISFYSLDQSGSELSESTIPVERSKAKNGYMGVMPGVDGNVAIWLFDKKEETIEIFVQEVKL